jgi:uncharacterized membrane protein
MAIPPAYIIVGIRKKDVVFIRIGLVLFAASILTLRYYYAIMPAEIAMLVWGGLLAVFGYWLTKYLSVPKHGFGLDKTRPKPGELSALETLLVIDAANKKEVPQPTTEFGGGSFGGGGAGANY